MILELSVTHKPNDLHSRNCIFQSRKLSIAQLQLYPQTSLISPKVILKFQLQVLTVVSGWCSPLPAVVLLYRHHLHSVLHDCHRLVDVVLDRPQSRKLITYKECNASVVVLELADCPLAQRESRFTHPSCFAFVQRFLLACPWASLPCLPCPPLKHPSTAPCRPWRTQRPLTCGVVSVSLLSSEPCSNMHSLIMPQGKFG